MSVRRRVVACQIDPQFLICRSTDRMRYLTATIEIGVPMTKPSVLLVEDHSVAREAMTRLLRYEGYDARSACNGIEAVAALTERTPDLLLLDLMLPKMNGVTLLKTMRNDSRWREVSVIVMTASVDQSQLDEVRGLGVSAIVPKAKFTLDELLHLMRSALCTAIAPAAMPG